MGESDRVFQGEAGEPTVVMVREEGEEGARIMASVLIIMASCTYKVVHCHKVSLFVCSFGDTFFAVPTVAINVM